MATFPSDVADKFVVRFPDGMRDQISKAAKASGRTMNAEVIARLRDSLSGGSVQLPDEIREEIDKAARTHGWPFESEVLHRLVDSFREKTEEQQLRWTLEEARAKIEHLWHRIAQLQETEVRSLQLPSAAQAEVAMLQKTIEAQRQVNKLLGYSLKEASTFQENDSSELRHMKEALRNIGISLWNGDINDAKNLATELAFSPEFSAPLATIKELGVANELPEEQAKAKVIRRTRRTDQPETDPAGNGLPRKRLVGAPGSGVDSTHDKVVERAASVKAKPTSKSPASSPIARNPKP
ncbi:MAG TPA: Arc family DNA-binding protein [Variovorax sp.]|nr:Arc family DNA-binding protein [Variovorax sp.]